MPCLLDIYPLASLDDVCREHGVVLQAFGGVVTRAALTWSRTRGMRENNNVLNLFDLTPFAADVDLTHSAGPAQTGAILQSILLRVPAAEAFRWQVRSEQERDEERNAMRCNNTIPARLMTLSTVRNSAFLDPERGLDDIKALNFRYTRNKSYKSSPLYVTGRDQEFFSAILFAQTLLEADLSREQILEQDGFKTAKEVMLAATESTEAASALSSSAYLRARLRYLLNNIAAASNSIGQWSGILDMGFRALIHYFEEQIPSLNLKFSTFEKLPDRFFASSSTLGSGRMRVDSDDLSPEKVLSFGNSAARQASQIFSKAAAFEIADQEGSTKGGDVTPVELAASQTVAVIAGPILPEPGDAPSSRLGSMIHEFVHFHIPLSKEDARHLGADRLEKLDLEENLSAIVALSAGDADDDAQERWLILALPTVVSCGYRDEVLFKLKIRVNCLGIFENAPPPSSYRSEHLRPSAVPYLVNKTEPRRRTLHFILLRLTPNEHH
jgi:hypothetical protein